MALVIRKDPEAIKVSGLTIRSYEIDFDSSYPTGGEAWDLSADFDVIKAAVFEDRTRTFELTSKDAPASSKVKAYFYDYDAVADGVAIEVAATTDLSAVTKVGVIIFGKSSK